MNKRLRRDGICAVIPPIVRRRSPIQRTGKRWRSQRLKVMTAVNHLSSHDRQLRLKVLDVFSRDIEIVVCEHGKICQLSLAKFAFGSSFGREPAASLRIKPQRLFSCQPVLLRIEFQPSHCLTSHKPVEAYEWVEAGYTSRIGSGSHRAPQFEHSSYRRSCACGIRSVTVHKIFALISHAMLYGNASSQRNHTLDVSITDCFRVIEEPVHSVEWDIAVYVFEHIEKAFNRLVIGCMQAEGPVGRSKMADNGIEFALQYSSQVRSRLQKVFKIRCREHKHLAGAVQPERAVPLMERRAPSPALEVVEFMLGPLREQVIGNPHSHLIAAMQFGDHAIVVWVILRSSACVDCAGHAKAVHLTHEMPCRNKLIFE